MEAFSVRLLGMRLPWRPTINTHQQKRPLLTRTFYESLKDGWAKRGWVQLGQHVDCLGGAQGPSEQSSEIQSVKIAMGSGVPLTLGSVFGGRTWVGSGVRNPGHSG